MTWEEQESVAHVEDATVASCSSSRDQPYSSTSSPSSLQSCPRGTSTDIAHTQTSSSRQCEASIAKSRQRIGGEEIVGFLESMPIFGSGNQEAYFVQYIVLAKTPAKLPTQVSYDRSSEAAKIDLGTLLCTRYRVDPISSVTLLDRNSSIL